MNPSAQFSQAPTRSAASFAIVDALAPAEVEQVRGLFVEYAQSLDFSLCFQEFDKELAGLPRPYVRPAGRLLLGLRNGQPMGCVGLRPLEPGVCEMKRLYVKPEARRTGLGPWLAQRAVTEARAEGYHIMRLDTLVRMEAAIALYGKMGFVAIGNYNGNPLPDALFFELDLGRGLLSA